MLDKKDLQKIQKEFLKHNGVLPDIFDALSDTVRYQIFRVLQKYKDLCVTDIAHIFDISVPAASQQLKILETNELVHKQRMGQMTCYRINKKNPVGNAIIKLIKKHSKK
ncbi:MAG: winged helix-turn-helix transcriptional regulator [Candidatus Magasanikbacteria bacterium]|uniref:HTH arsR-type domain-containing protein n=1 Tax=Candidatus Magasanikbacteria bacterium CG10_big_fil_rev_8_21_14_0_10_38_6 TaxID=1974647 RepID=A0A2M6P226_9BACT|nr:winged helix-turn-helix transcriptional regulator [bacterium]NCS71970.1 winged helix-turn-helix transcriptional regulator [Candidatus Magasanikbacteria bacterium]PIR77782.1 MAG: hypothetical protein COU30_00615 [Candidatus Magasanikbacteria bacterium CG10_big_fil_rev_8_21_14_0_10_38_6]